MKKFENEEEKRTHFLKLSLLRMITRRNPEERAKIDEEINELEPDDRETFIKINNGLVNMMRDVRVWDRFMKHK